MLKRLRIFNSRKSAQATLRVWFQHKRGYQGKSEVQDQFNSTVLWSKERSAVFFEEWWKNCSSTNAGPPKLLENQSTEAKQREQQTLTEFSIGEHSGSTHRSGTEALNTTEKDSACRWGCLGSDSFVPTARLWNWPLHHWQRCLMTCYPAPRHYW